MLSFYAAMRSLGLLTVFSSHFSFMANYIEGLRISAKEHYTRIDHEGQ